MYFIFWYDYVLLPFYLIGVLVMFNLYYRRRHGTENPELRRHFNRGMALKLVGCISIGLIYEHYYNGAYDGRFYFEGAKMLTEYWKAHPAEISHVLINNIDDFNLTNLDQLDMSNAFIFANSSFSVCKVAGIFNFFSFNAFLPCSIFFCYFAFIAVWNLFLLIRREFGLSMNLAGACTLYIPSVIIWDAGIFKDTISFSALCWMFVCIYYLFIKRRRILRNIIGLLVATVFVAQVKVYILGAFAPGIILYIFSRYKEGIRNPGVRALISPAILVVSVTLAIVFLQNSSDLLGIYSLNQVLETANSTYTNIQQFGGKAGSSYDLNVDVTSTSGILFAIPTGINLTLFRPYPWEYFSPFILLASAESMLVLYFTLYVIFKVGFFRSIRTIFGNALLQFCFLYSLTFAFLVGLSAANFGTLVRYKIPCMPFYVLALVVLYQSKFGKAQEAGEAATVSNI